MLIKAGEAQRNIGGRAFIVVLVAVLTLMPTYSAFAEIHATPVVEPTPVEVVEEVPERDSVDAIRRVEKSEEPVQPASVVGSDAVVSCNPIEGSLVPGDRFKVGCVYEFEPALGLLDLLPTVIVRAEGLANGYQASIRIIEPNGTDSYLDFRSTNLRLSRTLALLQVNPGGVFRVSIEIEISVPEHIIPGERFQKSFNVCANTLIFTCGHTGSIIFDEAVVLNEIVEEQHYLLDCGSPTWRLDVRAYDVPCQVQVTQAVGDHRIQLEGISTPVTQGVSHWDADVVDLQSHIPHFLASDSTFNFTVRMTPLLCSAVEQRVVVEVRAQLALYRDDQPVDDPVLSLTQKVVTPSFELPDPSADVEITFVNNPRDPFDYDLTDPTENINGSLGLKFSVGGCVFDSADQSYKPYASATYATMSDFRWTPSELYGTVPPPEGSKVPTLEQNDHDYGSTNKDAGMLVTLNEEISSKPLSNDRTLLITASSGDGTEKSVEHTINLEYTIPANTPVGIYTSTITVTTSDAP